MVASNLGQKLVLKGNEHPTNFCTNLFGINIEDLSSIGRGDSHKLAGIHLPWHYTLFPNHWHAVFNTIHTIGYLGKVIFPKCLLWGWERAVVCTCCLKVTTAMHTSMLVLNSQQQLCTTLILIQYTQKWYDANLPFLNCSYSIRICRKENAPISLRNGALKGDHRNNKIWWKPTECL